MQPTCLRPSNPPVDPVVTSLMNAPFKTWIYRSRKHETIGKTSAPQCSFRWFTYTYTYIYDYNIYIYIIITDYICNHTHPNKNGICRCQFEHASNPEDFQLPCERRFPSWNMTISYILHSNALQSSPNKKTSNCWLYSYTIHYITTKRVIVISIASLPSGYLT